MIWGLYGLGGQGAMGLGDMGAIGDMAIWLQLLAMANGSGYMAISYMANG
jgi:hypothetical protein